MRIVHVHIRVQPVFVEAFLRATLENAQHSRLEPGVAQFDVFQQSDDPTRFVIVEGFRTLEGPAAHKESEHYGKWRDTVAGMMAEPRSSVQYHAV